MATLNHLYILADHIKLSLVERQRASSALAGSLDPSSQDGHIAQSLEQMRDSIAALKRDQERLRVSSQDEDKDATEELADSLPELEKTLDSLTSQFHRFTAPSPTFPSSPQAEASPVPCASPAPKNVRFRDSSPNVSDSAALFGAGYHDRDETEGYRDTAETGEFDNGQIHAYHDRIMDEQDEHLDRLGESISRQRELSMRIGDELDAHIDMLDDTESLVDRHASRLDRARRSLGRIAEGEGDSRGCFTIVVLIIILLLLIAVFK